MTFYIFYLRMHTALSFHYYDPFVSKFYVFITIILRERSDVMDTCHASLSEIIRRFPTASILQCNLCYERRILEVN